MARLVKSKFLCLLFFCFVATIATAQQQPFTTDQWEDVAKDLDYSEAPEKERKTDFKTPNFNFNLGAKVIKYVIFLSVLGLLMYFIVRYLLKLKGQTIGKNETLFEVKTIEEAEENPMQANLQKLISTLVAEEKYREATRAYYLFILQTLYRQNIIEWKKPKTNFDYVKDVSQQHFYLHFKELTRYFERIWYGHQTVNLADFNRIEPQFKWLLGTLENEKK